YGGEIVLCNWAMMDRHVSYLSGSKNRFIQPNCLAIKGWLVGRTNINSNPSAEFFGRRNTEVFNCNEALNKNSFFFLLSPESCDQSDAAAVRENIRPQLPPARVDHHNESANLQEGADSNGAREDQRPPIGR